MSTDRGGADYLLAAESALRLIGRVEVAQRWDRPSALPQMTVGAVAAHLGTQVLTVHAALTAGEGVTQEPPVPRLEHGPYLLNFGRIIGKNVDQHVGRAAAHVACISSAYGSAAEADL